ncbi:MAG: prepilin-type N-terminal cleavage/methylation domain-containing protein [Phycisphaerales bacterium]
MRRAFTLLELLVVLVTIAVLIALVAPGLAGVRGVARATLCGSRLLGLGHGLSLYMNDFDQTLPQALNPMAGTRGGGPRVPGPLFGGTKGRLPMWGIDQVGARGRPLNGYLDLPDGPPDEAPGRVDLAAYRSPCDAGADETYLGIAGFERLETWYDAYGTSYVINDHDLDGDGHRTLIPEQGGRMPPIADPTKTWVLGSAPIYAYQQDSDRGLRWYHPNQTQANLLFADMHVRLTLPIPNEWCVVENTTAHYTFLPTPYRP